MKTVASPKEIQKWALEQRKLGKTIAFVPTMGALHEGHLSLLRAGRSRADFLVLSIFVNPAQFGPNEDLAKYPHDLESDLLKAKSCDVDIVFLPSSKDIYPADFQNFVEVGDLAKPLCGVTRPEHFRGVATVVLKLFNIVQPHFAFFGQKDFQQLRVIEQMVQDLSLPVEIIGMPIVREADGLAMSSRNRYLSPEEREMALTLSRVLNLAQDLAKKRDPELLKQVTAFLEKAPGLKIDYVTLCDPKTLKELPNLQLPALLALACFVGKTRLIDNRILL